MKGLQICILPFYFIFFTIYFFYELNLNLLVYIHLEFGLTSNLKKKIDLFHSNICT